MLSDDDIPGLVVSIGGKKVSVSPGDNTISHLATNLPPEAALLLESIQGQINPPTPTVAIVSPETTELLAQIPPSTQTEIPDPNNIRNISETNPDLRSVIEQGLDSNKPPGPQKMVRARSAEMQIALDRQDALEVINNTSDPRKKLTIYECGIALGIIVGSTKKEEVCEIMKNFSKIVCPPDNNDLMFFYNDIQITVLYNDDMVVNELQFGDFYKGQTSKGLQLGDPLEKAIELYGPPRMKSPRGAIWTKFGVFCQNNRVNTIRIQA